MRKREIKRDDKKLGELILLISEWSQADQRFGATKLNKLLFHSDFTAFLDLGVPITGHEYFALPQGPAPKFLKPVTETMKKNQELAYQQFSYYGRTQQRPIALRSPDVNVFSQNELNIVHHTVQRFWNMNATEISDHSHLFLGWKVARLKEVIPYNTALISRRPPTAAERSYGLTLQALAESHLSAHR
ncbi:MAG TPA: Panacea domain-containing protein [Terriglobia bacterium]|nr:Panacea domain-containing protein [Terriglobia bacterium]